MLITLVVVHIQAVLVPLWMAMRCRGWWFKSGFACFSMASLAEMVDHTTTDWVYVNHNSSFNGVFYGALVTGLALLTTAVSRSDRWRLPLLLITTAALAAYPLAGKSVAISFQSLLLVLMLCQWWRRFADPRLWLYVFFWSGVDHSDGNTARWKWRSHLASIHRTVRLSERHFSRLGNAAIINDELVLAVKQLRDLPEVNATGRSYVRCLSSHRDFLIAHLVC